jgi:isopenicillin N synthase-like dioxygenase
LYRVEKLGIARMLPENAVLPSLPVISLASDPAALPGALADSFGRYGFAMVADHGIDSALIARAWDLTAQFFALPDAQKRRWHIPGQGGARGYTPFGTEIAKGAAVFDLKEFWHVGRDLAPGHPLSASMPPNVWPDRPEGFAETFRALYAAFDQVGACILSHLAVSLDLPPDWFAPAIADGNSVLRLLHYPPIADAPDGAIRAGAHEDINLITLLLGAEEAGLELLSRDGQWIAVTPPPGALAVNIGDMLQRLTNHRLPSTTHRVRNPVGARARFSRYSMPYFLHLRSDFAIRTLPGCIDCDHPDLYPEPITADAYLQQRLREIGLIT